MESLSLEIHRDPKLNNKKITSDIVDFPLFGYIH